MMIGIVISSHSKYDAPATLTIAGHPTVSSIVVSRDLGDTASRTPGLHGMPCLLLNFKSPEAAEEALARLRILSARLYHRQTPTQIACGGGVAYTLRVLHGFDETAIAAIEQHHTEASDRYEAAQQAYLHGGMRRSRR
jgi:hypothetical protein